MMSVSSWNKNIKLEITSFLPSTASVFFLLCSATLEHPSNEQEQSDQCYLESCTSFFPHVNPREPTQEKGGGFLTRRDSYIWRYFFKSSNSWCMDSFSSSFGGLAFSNFYFLLSFGVCWYRGKTLDLLLHKFAATAPHVLWCVVLLFCSVYVSYASYIECSIFTFLYLSVLLPLLMIVFSRLNKLFPSHRICCSSWIFLF